MSNTSRRIRISANSAFVLITLLLYTHKCYSQIEDDYKDYIKLHVESYPVLGNYDNNIAFENHILKADADRFSGKTLSATEYKHLLMFVNTVYLDQSKSAIAFEVIRTCDLGGLRKISTVKMTHKGIPFYDLILYLKEGYLCKEWSSPTDKASSISKISIGIKTSEDITRNLKKSIIKLAQLYGATNVIDGDNLFSD